VAGSCARRTVTSGPVVFSHDERCSIADSAIYLGHHDPAVTLRIYGPMRQHSHERAREIIDKRMFRPRAVSGASPGE
jgi:hypothetical protein